MRVLAGALALGLLVAAAPPAAEAGHRHSRSCGHGYRYDSRGYRDYRYDRYGNYGYDRYDQRGLYRYDDYRYDDYRPYRSSRRSRYYGRRYGPSYLYRPYYGYRSWYGPYGGVRIGGPRLGIYLNW